MPGRVWSVGVSPRTRENACISSAQLYLDRSVCEATEDLQSLRDLPAVHGVHRRRYLCASPPGRVQGGDLLTAAPPCLRTGDHLCKTQAESTPTGASVTRV